MSEENDIFVYGVARYDDREKELWQRSEMSKNGPWS